MAIKLKDKATNPNGEMFGGHLLEEDSYRKNKIVKKLGLTKSTNTMQVREIIYELYKKMFKS